MSFHRRVYKWVGWSVLKSVSTNIDFLLAGLEGWLFLTARSRDAPYIVDTSVSLEIQYLAPQMKFLLLLFCEKQIINDD